MKPMELSCITEVWKSALKIVGESLSEISSDLQLWFPWGETWRGHDNFGTLPPTDFPDDLAKEDVCRFGGRLWKSVSVNQYYWLISVKASKSLIPDLRAWELDDRAREALNILGEFIRLKSILSLSMKVLENRANEHPGHWDRVTSMSVAIGEELGLSRQEISDLEVAAMLHDIGKVSLPDRILESPDKLSEVDRKRVEEHTIIGSTMVREAPGMNKIADYILFHHESPNGSGYPRKKVEEEIPLGALIISVADAFDAMTHFRPYASERTYLESFTELKNAEGKFSSIVLDALEKVLKKVGILDSKPMVQDITD